LTEHAFQRYNERVCSKNRKEIIEEIRHSDRIASHISGLMFKKDQQVAYWNHKDAIFIIKPEKGQPGKFIIVTILSVKEILNRKKEYVQNMWNVTFPKKSSRCHGLKCINCLSKDILYLGLVAKGYCYDCGIYFKVLRKIKYSSVEGKNG